ncbi:MAG: DNA polymerase I [Eubacteriales bacterium SKADARSKE-1]|nr:DNA polymerase I [Eubacteriales bacterium SKADARSKE-1]
MKLLVLDGNSILNRAFYGIKLLTTKSGVYTNAIYGFLTMMNKVKEETQPDAIAIAFDLKAPTFRHKEYSEYKAKRKGMPDELFMQLPILKELLTFLGYKLVECEGFEADDILGTLAKACIENSNECIIATGDKDSLQLVSPHVSVRIAATKFGRPEVTLFDEDKIFETYKIKPAQLIDVKALQGDTSDNIPGVPGIGQKGALDLIQKFHSIDNIYENIDTLEIKDGMRKKLIEGKDSAYMSRYLGTIVSNAPIDTDIKNYIPEKCDEQKAGNLLADLEMFSLISKMGLRFERGQDSPKKEAISISSVTADEAFSKVEKLIKEQKSIDFIIDTEDSEIKKIAFFIENQIYIENKREGFVDFLKDIFENQKIAKRTHNAKLAFEKFQKVNIEVANISFDTMLAAYLLNPSAKDYDLKRLSEEYSIVVPELKNVSEENQEISKNVVILSVLANKLLEEIKERDQEKLLVEIEIPFSKVLADMESRGFLIDKNGLVEYGEFLKSDIEKLEVEIHSHIGENVNINSPKQLGKALFEDLSLPKGKKTKSGFSTSAEVLEGLKHVHPVIDLILQYRTVTKLKSTYCEGLVKAISDDGRIHSIFNQTETKTGRISSLEPNLQNIPVRTELGKEFRKFFVAKEGYVLVDADYSQIELRILAHISNDEIMIEAFKNNLDIHTITASQVFNMPQEMVTPLMRSRAKAVNFGIVYGIGAFSLAKDIGITRKEAENYINNYLENYSGVKNYMQSVIEKAKEHGYVETLFGRRRYLPELVSSNFNLRSFGERVARNMPIQGTAADIIKIAMIRVENRLKKENLKAGLILQVHDELIAEAPVNEAENVKAILEEEMKSAANLKVPLVAEANTGNTWNDAHS